MCRSTRGAAIGWGVEGEVRAPWASLGQQHTLSEMCCSECTLQGARSVRTGLGV